MKILRISSKSIAFAALLLIPGIQASEPVTLAKTTMSIEAIHHDFDEIMLEFKTTLGSSFSEKSTERLDQTLKKIAQAELRIKEFVKARESQFSELKNSNQSNTDLYAFITILLKIADELEKHFGKVYSVLHNGLKKKLNATAFANQLTNVGDSIVTEENFKKIDHWLEELQKKSPKEVAAKIKEIRTDMDTIFRQYKSRKNNNAKLLAALRKRLPY